MGPTDEELKRSREHYDENDAKIDPYLSSKKKTENKELAKEFPGVYKSVDELLDQDLEDLEEDDIDSRIDFDDTYLDDSFRSDYERAKGL